MRYFAGPRLYYSVLGARGLILGARARVLRKKIEVRVEHPSLQHPVHLRLKTTDVDLSRSILLERQYECDLARPPCVIVDAGANIGLASIFYANEYPNARIIALEPEPSNYAMLIKNTAPYPNITPVNAALWGNDEEIQVIDPGRGHIAFQTCGTAASLAGTVVRTAEGVTVGRLMANFGIASIDLLKIDIEGAEREVFGSAGDWISRVGVIAAELHDWLRPGASASAQAVLQQFDLSWTSGEITYWARRGLAGAPSRSLPSGKCSGALRIVDAMSVKRGPYRARER